MKILIICPVKDKPEPECEISLVGQGAEILIHKREPEKEPLDIISEKSKVKNIVLNRNEARTKALATDADYFLWVDGDIILPKDAVKNFLKYVEKGQKFLGGWYRKVMSPDWVAAMVIDNQSTLQYYKTPQLGLTQVDLMGCGCMFMAREVLEKIEFRNGTDKDFRDTSGKTYFYAECLSFCEDAKKIGYIPTLCGDVICEHIDLKTKIFIDGKWKLLRDTTRTEIESYMFRASNMMRQTQQEINILTQVLQKRQGR
jgi:hypothetical protein